ncbi:hypothetical protein CC78DRAFT_543113 [Lojkania enalia]|uniref:RING-type domain-containing protein n=1 Tax=Lojkania enalia TaxID=147567 RepID=A0A9P4N124_9PLEO|nr:hypothetical protein CC78DRAFT_543113 [Didymosphaeria enalia]
MKGPAGRRGWRDEEGGSGGRAFKKSGCGMARMAFVAGESWRQLGRRLHASSTLGRCCCCACILLCIPTTAHTHPRRLPQIVFCPGERVHDHGSQGSAFHYLLLGIALALLSHSVAVAMNTRPSPTPPATARPKNSSSSITSSHAGSSSHSSQTMASSSKSVRGGTPTTSRSSKAADGEKPARPSSKDSLKQKMTKKAEDPPKPTKAEEDLKALRSDFDGLRSHLTCKICDRLLYQPYVIACGHTYCYSCLCQWFASNKARKTCPDCRAVVTQIPAPAYVIRDMTTIFFARPELLPPGDSLEQHQKWRKEEADLVQQDKDNKDPKTGGLFKGCFRSTRHSARSLRVVRDQEDGVDRCPMCNWELEDGECAQCGLFFDANGELTWGDSFAGFSDDLDEFSEHSMSGEDLDVDNMGFDLDPDGYDEPMEGWDDYLEDENFMMRRFLEHRGIPPQAAFGRRRRMTHSEAGSRRSYSQSIVSDMFTDEMDTVEEEDEDGLDGNSSMNDFIDDGEVESTASPSASSSLEQTPQPPSNRSRVQGRARRIVESEASSSVSSVIEEEDEEDQGPIRPGQRNRAQTRVLNRANGSRGPADAPSSTSTDASGERELDEDTQSQAWLMADGWMLQHDGPDEEMDEDDDSDGGRTTVGWDATAISNDRLRMGGSLTPTTDRPRPNAPIRPPSRAGNPRFMDASRGLRRRTSVLSTSTYNHEDAEADDDNSDLDQDGDIAMAMSSLQRRRSRAQMRNAGGFGNPHSRFANRGFSQGDAIDLDTDDNSDSSQQPGHRRPGRQMRHQEYNPRISWMFADHQRALQEFQRAGAMLDQEHRSTTPIARPRTANRNRPSPAQAFSPFMPPAPTRLRTPLMDNSSNIAASRGPTSPSNRTGPSQNTAASSADSGLRAERAASTSSVSNTSGILTPGTETPTSQSSVNAIAQAQAAASVDMIDRPPSRVSARPPSAAGRRNSQGFSPVYPGFSHPPVGLNIAGGRIFQNQRMNNPWGPFLQTQGVRTRTSRTMLRDQSSTATLRAANIRDSMNTSQTMRSQASRGDLRSQPSRRRLNNQASTRTLRASEHARPPQSPTTNITTASQPATRSTRLTPDERDSLARELINNRLRELGGTYQRGANPSHTNPFAPGFRRPSLSSEIRPTTTATSPQHIRNNSNDSVGSIGSSVTAQAAQSSPHLHRRRSNQNMTGSSLVSSPAQGAYPPPANTYPNSYLRARQGSLTGSSPAYETPLGVNNRGMTPMVTAGNSGGSLI